MPARTNLYQLLPWDGGLNTSMDESTIAPNQLTVADNVVFGTRGSRKKREGINRNWDDQTSGTDSIIGLQDFWRKSGGTATQKLVAVSAGRHLYSYNPVSGARTALTVGGTAWSGTLSTACFLPYNNRCFIAVSGATNVVKYWDGTSVADLPNVDDAGVDVSGTSAPPLASILVSHQGRIFCNAKGTPDRLYYSPTNNHTQWNGYGDSGAIDIGVGDGDPEGITGLASWKGDLFVFKRTRIYRVTGFAPETWQVAMVTNGVGCISHNSLVAVDQDDLFFVSDKGVHSMAATANYGDFSSNYVSIDIQRTFNDDFDHSRLKYTWAGYLPSLNAVAFTFTEEQASNRVNTTGVINNAVWLYNIPFKAWFRWPDISCQSLCVANDADQRRFYFGTHTGRISRTLNGTNYDVNEAGTQVAVKFKVVTGQLFLDGSPYTTKGFKRFILYYKPRGGYTITANLRIDNVALDPENSLNFSNVSSAALLGAFTLGASTLGYDVVVGPYIRSIDGYGRGVKITIEQTGTDEEVEIQGFAIEFEGAGTSPESAQN